MPYIYERTVRFHETDAAGVVYFANVLAMCHEAYEASLAASSINLHEFFCYPKLAIPITHASVDFFRPMFCGDRQTIHLTPRQISNSNFEIDYEIYLNLDRLEPEESETGEANPIPCVARAQSQHVCINSSARARASLPPDVLRWMQQWGKIIEIL